MRNSRAQAGEEEKTTALHIRIKEELESRILSGEWPPGHRIPPEHELTAIYGCSRMTVNKAISWLAKLGLVERRMGAGSFVARPERSEAVLELRDTRREVIDRGAKYKIKILYREIRAATRKEQGLLSGTPRQVLSLRCTHFAGARPFAFEDRLINLDEAPAAAEADFTSETPGAWLLSHVPWSNGMHKIQAVAADAEMADMLHVSQGHPCFCIERWTWRSETKISYAKQHFPGDQYQLIARFIP